MDADTAGKEADAALEALDASGAVLARGAMTDGMARIALEHGRPPLRLHPPMWRPCA